MTSAPADSEEARALLQQRVCAFARVGLVLGALIQAVVRYVSIAQPDTAIATGTEWTPNAHLLVLATHAVILWRTRSGRRAERELAVLDALCILAPSVFSLLALWGAPPTLRPNLLHVMSIGALLVLRAVLVPSTAIRTLAIGAVAYGAVLLWTRAFYDRFGAGDLASAGFQTAATAVWATIFLIVTTLASRTILCRRGGPGRPRPDPHGALGVTRSMLRRRRVWGR